VLIDATGPSVNVTHPIASNLTNSTAPVTFTFTFSDPVTGFAIGDVALANGSAGIFTPVSPTTYTLVVTPTGDGLVSASVPAGAAADAQDTLPTLAGFTLDRTAPTVAITAPSSITSDGTFLFVFSEPMVGFDSTDLTITGGSVPAGAIALVPGTSSTYRVVVTATGPGNLGVTVTANPGLTDRAGNPLGSSVSSTVTYQAGLAGLTIQGPAGEPNLAATMPITFTFSGPATGFTAADVSITNGSGGALVASSASVYVMTVTPAARGLVRISVPANICMVGTVGAVGNQSATLVVNHDPSGPMPSFSIAPLSSGQPGQAVWLTITFDEDVSGFDPDLLTVTNGTKSAVETVVPGRVYKVLVTIAGRPNSTGTVTLQAGAATGANGRPSQAVSIELVEPIVPPTTGGDRGCGLGSGLALLLMWLFAGLSGRRRFLPHR
jgi:hypothetical protein